MFRRSMLSSKKFSLKFPCMVNIAHFKALGIVERENQ